MSAPLPVNADYLEVLSRFPTYLRQAWHDLGDGRGYFGDPSHLEAGARTAGNVVFCAALLATDPAYRPLEAAFEASAMLGYARAAIRYMTSGHVTGERTCADGQRWGGVWQSAWWATRMALGARLIWDELREDERAGVERVVTYEADALLPLIVPSGLAEDTKAEENAWDAEILATAVALFPRHPHRSRWWEKLCQYGFNVFSVARDRECDAITDGKALRDWVCTVNLHSDFTLENHGAYHFCYVASPLHSLAWATHALHSAGIEPPAALRHHVLEVWNTVKHTFLNRRFAYVGGQDWARYTYGEYFIVPALVWLQSLFHDADARAIEQARFDTLRDEQRQNTDGSFFGRRFTQPHYRGQSAKYETDCYANIGLAYCLRCALNPTVPPTPPARLESHLAGRLVSPECGVAFVRSQRLFASFSWKTLTSPYPLAIFAPIGHDDLAEWSPGSLFGRILLWNEDPSAVWIRRMRETDSGFEIRGTVVYRGRKGHILYTHDLQYHVNAEAGEARVASRFVARRTLRVRRIEGLALAIPNDRFNGFVRRYESELGVQEAGFREEHQPIWLRRNALYWRMIRRLLNETLLDGSRLRLKSRWLNVDGVLGIVAIGGHHDGFVICQAAGRNLDNGSLHVDRIFSPVKIGIRRYQPGDEILTSEFRLIASDAAATRRLLLEDPA